MCVHTHGCGCVRFNLDVGAGPLSGRPVQAVHDEVVSALVHAHAELGVDRGG